MGNAGQHIIRAPVFWVSPTCGQAVTQRHRNAFQEIFSGGKKEPAAIELHEGASRVRSRFARFMSTEEAFITVRRRHPDGRPATERRRCRPTWVGACRQRSIRKEVMSH